MTTLTSPAPPAKPGRPSLWEWFLRSVGVDTWFNQKSNAAPAGREERVFLSLLLPDATSRPGDSPVILLTKALAECMTTIREGDGEVAHHQDGQLLLTWPMAQGARHAVGVFFQLRASVQRRDQQAKLYGAASLGWVKPSPSRGAHQYRGEVLGSVVGILHEAQQQGSELLTSAALYHQLAADQPFHFHLHVAFDVPGHRYPATLYQVTAERPANPG
jgi:hypothetical protein